MIPDCNRVFNKISHIRELSNELLVHELLKHNITGVVPAHGAVFAQFFQTDEPLQVTTLAKRIGRAKSTVTGMVNTLVKEGYLEKVACPVDKRNIYIQLTEKGKNIRKDLDEISEVLLSKVYKGFTEEEKTKISELLNRLEKNLKEAG